MNEAVFFTIGTLFGAGIAGGAVYFLMNSKLKLMDAFQQQLEKDRGGLEDKFENLALRILDEKTSTVQNQNLQNLQLVLNPLKERLVEFEKKISEANKGRSFTQEHKNKIAEANKGRVVSEETRKKIRMSSWVSEYKIK